MCFVRQQAGGAELSELGRGEAEDLAQLPPPVRDRAQAEGRARGGVAEQPLPHLGGAKWR